LVRGKRNPRVVKLRKRISVILLRSRIRALVEGGGVWSHLATAAGQLQRGSADFPLVAVRIFYFDSFGSTRTSL